MVLELVTGITIPGTYLMVLGIASADEIARAIQTVAGGRELERNQRLWLNTQEVRCSLAKAVVRGAWALMCLSYLDISLRVSFQLSLTCVC